MGLSKGKVAIGVVACAVIICGGVYLYNSNNATEEEKPVELVEVPSELHPVDEATGDDNNTEIEVAENTENKEVVDSKNFVYDPFAEDAGWGDESIFGDKIIITGGGKRDESGQQSGIIVEGGEKSPNSTTANVREMTAAEQKAALMEEVKSSDYHFRINENDFSDGFGLYMNPKYELSVGRIMGATGHINAPNNTDVAITELDPSVSLDEHRKKVLTDCGYGKVYRLSNGAIMEYNTPVTMGVGIDDFENTPMYIAWRYNDESINSTGGQLLCDTEAKSTFGSGYYIEVYSTGSSLYYGHYLVEHNGRIFKVSGSSTYRDTLRDITLATIDTCVYPY